LLKHSKTLC